MSSDATRRILVILDDCGPGDALRAGFTLDALRAQHPHSEIVLVAAECVLEIARTLPSVDRIVVSRLYEHRANSLLRLRLKKLRDLLTLPFQVGRGYDLAMVLLCGTTLLDLLAFMAARRRIGFSNRLPWLLSSRLGPYSLTGTPSAIEQHMRLLEAAGVTAPVLTVPPSLAGSGDERRVEAALAALGLADSESLIVLHPGSDWACQQWRPERWAALADELVSRHGAEVVFTGIAREQKYIAGIQARMTAPSHSLAGQTTLGELSALLKRSRLCICVDCAVHELSQGVQARTVVLTGPHGISAPAIGGPSPVFVDRAAPGLRRAILACKQDKYTGGGCLDYACAMAGLRDIELDDVLEAVRASGFPAAQSAGTKA